MKRSGTLMLLLLLALSTIAEDQKPNIVWITFEDMSPLLACYGDSTAHTPMINSLSENSKVFNNAFSTAGVCAPSRSAIITGMYPTFLGTNHMRTGRDIMGDSRGVYNKNKNVTDREGNNVIEYSAVIPSEVKCFPEYLRREGYYCTNNAKTDYQFASPFTAWDQNDAKAHWRNRKDGQPFFSVFNFNETHESKLWKHNHLPLTVSPDKVNVPDYYPDTPEVRKDIARVYSNLELLDKRVGEIIEQLKKDGLYDNTYIFFFSDHGGPMPRQKREVISSGLHVPFMIKYPQNAEKGYSDQVVNFIDLAPTVLEMAGVKVPKHLQGTSIQSQKRKYSFAARDRMDEHTSARRSVTDGKYLYVKYLYELSSSYQDIEYRKNVPTMQVLLELKEQKKLSENQMKWFAPVKELEALYDLENDPDELNNLIGKVEVREVEKTMRGVMNKWQKNTNDRCKAVESEMIEEMWPNQEQPQTADVKYKVKNGKLYLSCPTEGASIGYKRNNDDWMVYTTAIDIEEKDSITVKAIRIGYKTSNKECVTPYSQRIFR
ncbi:sulfatase family protein [Flammeovirga aprica]|uniref:Sulfatase n=1 Tax=Flammeovirga aprica JL-4 TaxID=694437 RepID=A0A7X9RXQ5_9BACT|nr:sulfatase [Flammeovirga aprica]NME70594.1 sulfatase [Flammeovirga aprica JL-4]